MKTAFVFVTGFSFGILVIVTGFALHAYFILQVAKPLGALHVLAITIGIILFVGGIMVHLQPKIDEMMKKDKAKINL